MYDEYVKMARAQIAKMADGGTVEALQLTILTGIACALLAIATAIHTRK